MCKVAVIFCQAFLVLARDKLSTNFVFNRWDSIDSPVEALVNSLRGRLLKLQPFHHTDLDRTTFAKTPPAKGHGIQHSTPAFRIRHLPRDHCAHCSWSRISGYTFAGCRLTDPAVPDVPIICAKTHIYPAVALDVAARGFRTALPELSRRKHSPRLNAATGPIGEATSNELIAVIGAGGPTGVECVRELQANGMDVRCVVRSREKHANNETAESPPLNTLADALLVLIGIILTPILSVLPAIVISGVRESRADSRLRFTDKFGAAEVVEGSVTDEASMKNALRGATGVVVVASGSSTKWDFDHPYRVDYLGVQNVARAAKACRIQKVVLVSCLMANSIRSNSTTNPQGEIVVDAEAFGGFNKEYYKFMGEEALRSSGITQYSVVF
eukprot:gnl/TRDRNA2_/TRDRNA2_146872_c1_seq1.p1 gnl/TRDRNA2_/TRDRNA2_146872_c1~~gnl/TRDRNA2_/TRDRNA2_146872_c1_seq1.p1  ORF type:complete len:385 (+),score=14.69 gnl/TRDRNA2_/TRDRNA2_146872_c1_seq1:104-1258(+)